MIGIARTWQAAFLGWTGRVTAVLFILSLPGGRALADISNTNPSPAPLKIDLASPAVMTGTFYALGSQRKTILFKYRRVATRAGDLIRVEQTFALPSGAVACRENIFYQNGELLSYDMADLRSGARGSILVEPDPQKPKTQRLQLCYVPDGTDTAKTRKNTEPLQPNTLISDTIYPFILDHWEELSQGGQVKFHFVSLDPAATFNFRLVRDSTSVWQGRPVLRIKMEPANFLLAHWIKPIFFDLEKAAPHRIFSYTGRTTPRKFTGGAWKFVDAEAVFDWP